MEDCLDGSEVCFRRSQRVTREAMAQSLMRSLNRAAEQRGEECFTPWETMSPVDRESAALVAVAFAAEIGVPVVDEGQRTSVWVPWPTHAGWWWAWIGGGTCLFVANADLDVRDTRSPSDEWFRPSDRPWLAANGVRFLDTRLVLPAPPEAP